MSGTQLVISFLLPKSTSNTEQHMARNREASCMSLSVFLPLLIDPRDPIKKLSPTSPNNPSHFPKAPSKYYSHPISDFSTSHNGFLMSANEVSGTLKPYPNNR